MTLGCWWKIEVRELNVLFSSLCILWKDSLHTEMESRELVTSHTCALLQRRRMASTGGSGSTSCSIFTQLRRIIAASLVDVAMTMPGQSRSLMCLSKCTSWRHLRMHQTLWWGEHDTHRKSHGCRIISSPRTHLVTPGVAPTLQARARFKLLIKLLLPTLGKPVDGYFTLEKVQFHTGHSLTCDPMRSLPTTPTVMAVFMSRLRQ